ncbi:MAG TPA: tetratricopeptide repeat protein, partial [Chitinophagaceae bacterium]|nr:tetratricopeptide repeat protein [Chitinophagaceae bacterium]
MRIVLHLLIIVYLLLAVNRLPAQCPSSDSLYRRITRAVNAPSVSEADKLKQLLQFNDQINHCPNKDDSAHIYLLNVIGVLSYQARNYTQAIEFTKKAIDIIRTNASKPAIKFSSLVNCYYNLQRFYDSLGKGILQREAADSCIAIDLRINWNHYYASFLLKDKIAFLFNKGDYVLCSKYADLTEKLLRQYYPDNVDGIWYTVVYNADALIFLEKYDEAERFLTSKINSFENKDSDNNLVQTYGLLGMINYNKGSYQKALNYFQRSAEAAKKARYMIGYAEALNWMGFIYTEKLREYTTGMSSYKKALLYADSVDAIRVYNYIGNAYVKKNLFDSASYFFQKAFDKIKPGFTEKELIT